jgi:hypothetical protein
MNYNSVTKDLRDRMAQLALEQFGTTPVQFNNIVGGLSGKHLINKGFIWSRSPEGYNFWYGLLVFDYVNPVYNKAADVYYFASDNSSPINSDTAKMVALYGPLKANNIKVEREMERRYPTNNEPRTVKPTTTHSLLEQPHYDNTNGSLYKFAQNQDLNAWEFDLVKRIVRCRKKGDFAKDLEKTKFLIDLYVNEYTDHK